MSVESLNMEAIWTERRSGNSNNRPFSEYRDDYTRDRARVIHSASFRRLQTKTQVLGIGEGDFHRTRLTHSMEVAQIARGIVNFFKKTKRYSNVLKYLPNTNLIETISLAHDLGHPPFGHGGEAALNFCMRAYGGFEGNGQTLRILSRLEAHTEKYGLDVTRRCLLGILKYPVTYSDVNRTQSGEINNKQFSRNLWKPPKCFLDEEIDIFNWITLPFTEKDALKFKSHTPSNNESHGKSLYKAFDTSILEIADDIAYGVHDFEDSIALGLISSDAWEKINTHNFDDLLNKYNTSSSELYKNLFKKGVNERKQAIGSIVNIFVTSTQIDYNQEFESFLLKCSASLEDSARFFLTSLKNIVYEEVILSQQVQTLEYRGEQVIIQLFNALSSDPKRLLPKDLATSLSQNDVTADKYRIICDYIASMTNEYATRLYERLFVPRQGQFSDRL